MDNGDPMRSDASYYAHPLEKNRFPPDSLTPGFFLLLFYGFPLTPFAAGRPYRI
jgi:hypothetical protein